jgi:hypothetical protein
MLAILAQHERELIVERVNTGIAAPVKKEPLWTAGVRLGRHRGQAVPYWLGGLVGVQRGRIAFSRRALFSAAVPKTPAWQLGSKLNGNPDVRHSAEDPLRFPGR